MNKIRYGKRGAVGLLELNRPGKLNAIDAEMREELGKAAMEAIVEGLSAYGARFDTLGPSDSQVT